MRESGAQPLIQPPKGRRRYTLDLFDIRECAAIEEALVVVQVLPLRSQRRSRLGWRQTSSQVGLLPGRDAVGLHCGQNSFFLLVVVVKDSHHQIYLRLTGLAAREGGAPRWAPPQMPVKHAALLELGDGKHPPGPARLCARLEVGKVSPHAVLLELGLNPNCAGKFRAGVECLVDRVNQVKSLTIFAAANCPALLWSASDFLSALAFWIAAISTRSFFA